MRIKKISNPNEENEFISLPFKLYKNDKNWIPHLKQDIERIFSQKKNKVFLFGKAERWIAYNSENQIVGRIAAFVNERTANATSYPTGGLGFFECIDNQEVANLLFDTGIEWLKQQEMQAVEAPINFGVNNEFWGLLTQNFTSPPTYLMPYNPEYYIKLFENYGFQIYYEQFMFHRLLSEPVQDIFARKAREILNDNNFRCSNVKGMKLEEIAENFLTVYNNAWTTHDGFKALTMDKALKIIRSMKDAIDPDIFIFAFYNENAIGFFVNLPELNQIFKDFNGNLNFIAKLKFLYHKWKKTPNTMYGLAFGVSKQFQGKGVEGAMIKFAEETILPKKIYNDIIMTWIGDFNTKMLKVVENLGAKKYRTFATYRKIFDTNAHFERYQLTNSQKQEK